jgi:hypothetical protein
MTTELFLDCGGPSIYNLFVRKFKVGNKVHTGSKLSDRKHDDFSFLKTNEYKEYRQSYADFLKENYRKFETIINLDIINNGEATWENQKWFEKQGLNVIPVWHYGTDIKWLENYMNNGYKHIALGGLHPTPFKELKEPLDEIWIKYWLDKKGYPKVKVHGFAVTGPKLIYRYPWWSVDSTSWVKLGLFGCVTIPKQKYNKPDYKTFPMVIFLSVRSTASYRKNSKHIDAMPEVERNQIISFIQKKGFKLGHSEVKKVNLNYTLQKNEFIIKKYKKHKTIEIVKEEGLRNNGFLRDTFNAMYYQDLAASVPKWPWKAKFYKDRGFF